MKIREEALLDRGYNICIAGLIVILILMLTTNDLVTDKVSELNRMLFQNDTEVHYDIVSHELPIMISYTKPGHQSDSVINDAIRYVLSLFGCKDDKPISILAAEHPLFIPYSDMMLYHPALDEEIELDLQTELKTGEPGEIVIPSDEVISSGTKTTLDKDLNTEGISVEMPVDPSYDYNNIKFINETGYNIHQIVQELYENPFPFYFDKNKSKIIIYHTHPTESFVSRGSDIYNSEIYTRSDDPSENICRVGRELYLSLEKYGYNVLHDTTVHDYPVFNNAYSNSLKTISGLIESNPNTDIVIDVHRNALDSDVKMRLPYETKEGTVAKISFVVATGEIGLPHENWKQNLQMALRLTTILESMYPGITDPVYISKYRYNQHVSTGALLVEIGAEGNLLEECIRSSRILAKAIQIMLS
jgi:stage II sporulation protein P